MLGWPWPNVTIWLCIGTATATVLTVLLNRHIRAHGETWSRTRKLSMTILDLTIVFMWPGFYVLLLLFLHPRSRQAIMRLIETGGSRKPLSCPPPACL
jgi:hypothetical protein